VQDEFIRIPLPHGLFTIVDAEDAPRATTGLKWHLDADGYVVRGGGRNKARNEKLHRVVMNAPKGVEVDHINGDKLDNRKCNLRFVTHTQNCVNAGLRKHNKSGYKGVSWEPRATAWRVYIRVNGKQIHLGHFKDVEDAARAYDAAAVEAWGEFAFRNFPDG
jgi:hypothetical protein